MKRVLLAFLISLSSVACTTHKQTGILIGGAFGSLFSPRVASSNQKVRANIVGTMLGASVGARIAQNFDIFSHLSLENSQETNKNIKSSKWRNLDTEDKYKIIQKRNYYTGETPEGEYTVYGYSDEEY